MSNQGKVATAADVPALENRPGRSSLKSPVSPFLKRVRGRRLVRRFLRIAAILVVSYLVIANVILRTRLLRNAISGSALNFAISGNTTALDLDYDSAYSIIPGRVHVEGLTIRGRERTVEWFLTLDRADVALSLRDLLHGSFHATRLRSNGSTIRVQLRLDLADATPEVIAALPPSRASPTRPSWMAGPSHSR